MLSLKFASPVLGCMYSSIGLTLMMAAPCGGGGRPSGSVVRIEAAILRGVEVDGLGVGGWRADALPEQRQDEGGQHGAGAGDQQGEDERGEEHGAERQNEQEHQPQRQVAAVDEYA